MTDEQRVSQLVRRFAAQVRPEDPAVAARAAATALRALLGGASVADAYAAGRRAVRSSPAPHGVGADARLDQAS